MLICRIPVKPLRLPLIIALAVVAATCGGGDKSPEIAKKPGDSEIKPTVHVPKPVQHYEGTPYWQIQSKNWPAIVEGTADADGYYTYDSLSLRLSGEVLQNFIDGPASKEHPLMCWIELTARPIPRQLVGYSCLVDSVVFVDPIKNKRFPRLPMLSTERHTEMGVVRTRFSNNLAFPYTPQIEENQPLQPIVYISSVDKKSFQISMSPLNVTFLRELKPETLPTDSLEWGPS